MGVDTMEDGGDSPWIYLLWLRFAEREWKGRWGSGDVLCLEVVRYDPVDYVVCSCRARS